MAAALAYRTIFSIIPVFVISLLVFSAFVSDAQLESGITRILNVTGLDTIVIDEADAEPTNSEPEVADSGATTEPGEADPVPNDPPPIESNADEGEVPEVFRIDQVITELVSRVRGSVENIVGAPIAIVSALILIYAALSMLVELERSFNQIFRAASGRPWLRRLILYWTMLTLGSVLLAATFYVGDEFVDWAKSLLGGTAAAAAALGYVVTVAISSLMLTIAYLAVPNTRVKLRPALAGALVAAVLWELGKWGFRQYLDFSAGYATFYGSLGLLPLFLIWVYATWLIVLFGLQVAYALQNFGEFDLREGDDDGPAIVDPACILLVASGVARRFGEGKSSFVNQIARDSGLPESLTGRMLRRLVELGVVHEVERGEDRAFALARPADSIDAADVLRAAAELSTRRDRVDEPGFARLAELRERELAGRSLADFVSADSESAAPTSGSP